MVLVESKKSTSHKWNKYSYGTIEAAIPKIRGWLRNYYQVRVNGKEVGAVTVRNTLVYL